MAGGICLTYLVLARNLIANEGRVILFVWVAATIFLLVIRSRRPVWGVSAARCALVGVVIYWALLFSAHQYGLVAAGLEVEERYPHLENLELSVLPRLANPFRWDLFCQDAQNVYHAEIRLGEGITPGFRAYARNLEHSAVRAALSSCPGSVMAHFARFEFFEVEQRGEGPPQHGKGPIVILRDARYTREATSGWGVLRVPLSPNLRRHRLEFPCWE